LTEGGGDSGHGGEQKHQLSSPKPGKKQPILSLRAAVLVLGAGIIAPPLAH
jgi:hypothetical protein